MHDFDFGSVCEPKDRRSLNLAVLLDLFVLATIFVLLIYDHWSAFDMTLDAWVVLLGAMAMVAVGANGHFRLAPAERIAERLIQTKDYLKESYDQNAKLSCQLGTHSAQVQTLLDVIDKQEKAGDILREAELRKALLEARQTSAKLSQELSQLRQWIESRPARS